MLNVPKTVPSRAKAQVVPEVTYMEKVWAPVETVVVPAPIMVFCTRFQIW
jgi:hypothetical protein